MRAAILKEQNKPLRIVNLKLPDKLDYGQVLVDIHYSTICGAQINEIDGVKGPDNYLPHCLGHEGSGIVLKTGPGVRTVKKGDKVVLHWRKNPNSIQSATPKYWLGKKLVNAGWVTTFQEKAVVSENRVTKIFSDADMRTAPLYGCSLTTAYGIIHNDAKMKIGDSIIIFGAGGLGLSLVIIAKLLNARDIVVVDINTWKLKMAWRFGATQVINSLKEEISDDFNFDVVVDTTGIKSVREKAYVLSGSSGVTVYAGVPPKNQLIRIDSFPLHFEKRVTGSHGGDAVPEEDIYRLMCLERQGIFNLKKMITKEFPLKDINEAIDLVREGNVIKCMIKMK